MLRRVLVCVLIGMTTFGLAAAADVVFGETPVPATPDAVVGGTLTVGVSQTFIDLDPRVSNSAYDSYVIGEIYDSLIGYDPDALAPSPWIAKGWEVLGDDQVRFFLNEGIMFHGGYGELTAEDVAFTFNWIADPDSGSPNSSELVWMDRVEIVDTYTVDIWTKPEYAPFAPGFTQETQSVVCKAAVEEMGDDAYNLAPIGSGPYQLVEWLPGDRLILERYEDYWLVYPNLDQVVYRPIPELSVMMAELEAGGIDIADNMPAQDVPRFQANPDVDVLQMPSLSYFYIFFNMQNSPSNDIRFRKAVYMSFDADAAVFSIFQGLTGVRAYGCVPPALWANDRDYLSTEVALEEDDAESVRLFAELDAEGLLPDSITVYCPLDPRRVQLTTILATSVEENCDMNVTVQPLDWGPILDLFYGSDADPIRSQVVIGVMGWSGSNDPHGFTYYHFTTENATLGDANNYSFYMNPVVDDLIFRADTTLDIAERERLYVEAGRIIFADYPVIPGYHYIQTSAVRSNVEGFIVDPFGSIYLTDTYHNVWLSS